MNTAIEPQTQVRTKITLPADAMERFERLAAEERKPLDQVLSERLLQCADHKAKKGIWLGDVDRASVEEATRTSIGTASDLVGLVRKAMRLKVAGAELPLGVDLLDRLRSRCTTGEPFEKWLAARVKEGLEELAGLR
jgi:hypothetical protein